MKVSIITAAFRAEYMDRVWASIVSQTHKEWEWIIVNDGQAGIREWYRKRREEGVFNDYCVWLIDNERCLGRFGLHSRNIGAIAARNKYIIFADDDNEFYPDHIESLLSKKEETGKTPYCDIHVKGKKPGSTFERTRHTTLGRAQIDLGCLLYDKDVLNKTGYFKDDAQVTFDWNCIERIIKEVGADNFVPTRKRTLIFWHRRY